MLIHRHALKSWFLQDDFAWLALNLEVHSFRDLATALFQPRAQGTIRVLSERAFFLIFSRTFGIEALPFHIFTLLTAGANAVLIQWTTWRLSASRVAGVLAALIYVVSSANSIPLAWLSSYNQLMCAFFALSAFACLIRYLETGRTRDWVLQWAFYLCGFLALESIVAYPAVACLYVWIAGRQHIKKALWLWLPSLAFVAFHFLLVPKSAGPKYQMVLDLGILKMLAAYWFKAIGPSDMVELAEGPWTWLGQATTACIIAGLVFFSWTRIRKGDWLPLVPIAWFACFIAPVLPLQHHVSDYYLALPFSGFAILMGWALASAFQANWPVKTLAILLVGIFIWGEMEEVYFTEFWYRFHGVRMRAFLTGVNEIYHRRKAETVMIAGVDDQLIAGGIEDNPFRLYGIASAYLAPGTETKIRSIPKSEIPFLLDQGGADSLLASDKTIVASVTGDKVADVTETYRAMRAGQEHITLVRPGDPAVEKRLGTGWYQSETAFRWMAGKATLRLDIPPKSKLVLTVTVNCPQILLDNAKGNLELLASIQDRKLGSRKLSEGANVYQFEIPANLVEVKTAEVTLQSSTTLHSTDGRELGLAIMEVAVVTK